MKRKITNQAHAQMLAKEALISAELARSLFSYDPSTGNLINKTTRRGRHSQVGTVAGGRAKGYIRLSINSLIIYAHRVVFLIHHGRWPVGECDHRDRNGFNNRIENLRECTKQANLANREFRVGACGYRGVTKDGNRFRVSMWHEGEHLRISGFADPAVAAVAAGALRDLLAIAA